MTHAEEIRNKDDKALAEFLADHIINALCSPAVFHGRITKEQLVQAELEWLQNEET